MPSKKWRDRNSNINLFVTPELKLRIVEFSKVHDCSISAAVRFLVVKGLQHEAAVLAGTLGVPVSEAGSRDHVESPRVDFSRAQRGNLPR